MRKHLDIAAIAAATNDRAAEIAPYILGEQGRRCGNTIRFGKNDRLAVYVRGTKCGKWIDFATGDKGDMLDLIARAKAGMSLRQAAEEALLILGLPGEFQLSDKDHTDRRLAAHQAEEDERAQRRMKAQKIWNNASPVGEHAIAYLRNRGISLLPGEWARQGFICRKTLSYFGINTCFRGFDTLVFAATTPAGELRAVQQVMIHQGRKAPVPTPKISRGDLRGAAVRIGHGPNIVLCEGPETGMSIHECTGLPVAVALGGSLLPYVEFGGNVRSVIIAADLCEAGIVAAEKAVKSLRGKGVASQIVFPPKGGCKDFNDLHNSPGGEQAVREAFRSLIM